VVELAAALVVMVAQKAYHSDEHNFSIVHQRQPADCRIADELVAEDAGDIFGMIHLNFQICYAS
jgi:hypothetical protein